MEMESPSTDPESDVVTSLAADAAASVSPFSVASPPVADSPVGPADTYTISEQLEVRATTSEELTSTVADQEPVLEQELAPPSETKGTFFFFEKKSNPETD